MKTNYILLITLVFWSFLSANAQQGIDFDGSNDQVVCPSGANPAGPFTVEFWMKTPGGGGAHSAAVSTRIGSGQNGYAFLVYSNVIRFQVGTTSFWQRAQANVTFVADQWYHIAGVYDGTTLRIYVDGVLGGTHTLTGSYIHTPGNSLRIGRGANSNTLAFKGAIDEVRVWSSVRTQGQIQANMNSEISSPPSDLVAYYQFNQGLPTGFNGGLTTVIDASGNNLNGTLQSSSLNGCESNWVCGAPALGACSPVGYCNPTWLGTTNSNWNTSSNWSDGAVPNATQEITILNVANDPIISGSTTVSNVEVQAGAKLNVASGGTLTLTGTLANSGAVTIEDGGSFLQGASSSISGAGTFNIKRQGGELYNMWSSPITSQNGIPGGSYLYNSSVSTQDDADDEHDPGWVLYNGSMTPGQGYVGHGGGLATFTGTPNNGNINYGLHYTAFDNTYTQTTPGTPFNLVGNPYPSAISAASFLAANADLDGTIYLWNENVSSDYSRTDYAYWNGTGGLGTGGGLTPNGFIASCQGFMVRALNGGAVANFTNSQRVAGNNTQFHKVSAEDSRIWFSVENQTERDEILIGFLQGATEDEDRMYDAVKLKGQGLTLSTINNTTEYAILALPPIIEERSIPLNVEISEAGEYSFTANSMENFEGQIVYFNDLQTGTSIELEEGQPITIELEEGDYTDRFYLNFSQALTTGIEDTGENELQVWVASNTLNVLLSPSVERATIHLMDMNGRIIRQVLPVAFENGITALSTDGLASGVYTVLATTDNSIHTQKLFIE